MNDAPLDPEAAAPPPSPVLASPDIAIAFSLSPDAAERLWRTRALTALRAGRTRREKLRLTWHDAQDGGLAKAGLALVHIEEPGGGVWETQQVVRDGSLIWPFGTPPVPVRREATPGSAKPPPPVAVLEGYCRRLAVVPGHGMSDVALLDGTLSASTTTRRMAQLNLRGTPPAVFDLARALLEELPLTVTEAGLSGEVRRIVTGGTPPKPPILRESLTVDDAFAHVVSQLTATIAHHAPGAREGRGVEPVHQMRVALRRLRSAMSLFRKLTGGPDLDRARADLAGLARALGPARDWDVFLAGTGREVATLLPSEKAVTRLMAAAERQRQAAYATLARLLDGPEFQHLLLDLMELAVARPWQGTVTQDRPALLAFARHALDRKLRQVTEAGEDLSPLPVAELHAARIRCKRLRYAAELFVPLASGKHAGRFLRRLAAVQERLGQLNDGAVAAGLLAELGPRGFAAGIVHGYLAARTAGSRAKAERSWRKFRRVEPFWQ